MTGFVSSSGTVTASYATGPVSGGTNVGGLVGLNNGTVAASYYNRQTTGQSDTGKGDPKTTRELQTPTEYAGTIYANWNADVDGVDGADDPWDFGTNRHYPALKIDFDGDGRATCREFGPQRCYREPGPPPTTGAPTTRKSTPTPATTSPPPAP